jgi:hypothetical protein
MRCAGLAFVVMVAACNTLSPKLTPVPAVHALPGDVKGTTLLIDEDPIIQTSDPVHIQRAKQYNVPHDLRIEMVKALGLAGFKVSEDPKAPFDFRAKLALAVSEPNGNVHQVYRCGLTRPDGTPVAQVDWAWPEGTYVGEFEVLEYAAHNLSTEVATSRKVLDELRSARSSTAPSPAPSP